MPVPGVPNNPSGLNNFDHFAPEPAYGEATKQDALKRGAPMAGAPIASGSIAAPKRAQKQAGKQQPSGPAVEPPVMPPPMNPTPYAKLAAQWSAIAAIPGASPLVQEYAQAAQRRLGGV